MSQGSGEKTGSVRGIELDDVSEAVDRAVNPYACFCVVVEVDAAETEDDPDYVRGNVRVTDEHRDGDVVMTWPLRWRQSNEFELLEVEFLTGEENWNDIDELPLSMYFHAVDLYRDLRCKAARLAAKE